MKPWEWYLLVGIDAVLLLISFVTKNLWLVFGTFALALYLQKFAKDIPLPEQFRKYDLISGRMQRVVTAEKRKAK